MARRGRLIVFLGPVGVGKSTIIRGLTQELRAREFRTYTTFIKAFHGPAYALWVLTARLLGLNGKYAPWFIIYKSGYAKLAKVLLMLSIYLDTFISIPLKLMIIRAFRCIGYYVVSEEYLQSAIFDYIYSMINARMRNNFISVPLEILNSLLNKYPPDITIALMVNISELKRRWAIRGYGDPQPRYVLLHYSYLKKLDHVFFINTADMRIKDTLNKVLNEIIMKV
jgi:thymidylate kinase